jgi:hypothetical protein
MTAKEENRVTIDTKGKFDLSPYLYMQFIEPLGALDGSVEACWDHKRDQWREDFVEITKQVAPPLCRWPGGCFTSFYRWREAVGPRHKRIPMINLFCGGIESNQIGTHEFMELCRMVGADPLIAINFESDGRKHWAEPWTATGYKTRGGIRSAGPEEAADWVDYCNSPDNRERKANGAEKPFAVHLWQIGNETSYAGDRGFDCETASQRTLVFAEAMKKADPSIELIGWGDSGWAKRVLEVAGEHLSYLAFHAGVKSKAEDSPLRFNEWRKDPEKTWHHLMISYKSMEEKILQVREEINGTDIKLAMTECHISAKGRNRCEVMSSWAAGVAYARALNCQSRHGDVLKIATMADFIGNRLMSMAVIIPGFRAPYMLPVARVMSLFGGHVGDKAVDVLDSPDGLDITASRGSGKYFLHVANTNMVDDVAVELNVKEADIRSGRGWQIVQDPMLEIDQSTHESIVPEEKELAMDRRWIFPAASVTAIELKSD